MKLSDFNPTQNTSSLVAGESFIPKDLAEIDGYYGKAYKVRVSNFAAIGNMDYGTAETSAATGRIVAQTSVVASQSAAYARQAVTIDTSGNIFTLTDAAANAGLRLSKFSPAGGLLGYVDIATVGQRYNHHILLLSNGNIACVAYYSDIEYAVYDANLVNVAALATVAASPAAYFAACALSGGGFAVLYQKNANPLLSCLKTYDNSGANTLAETTVWTRTGTTGTQYHKMLQLSSGNLAIAVSSNNTVSSIGLYYGVITTAGVSVKLFTSLDTTGSMSWYPTLAVMTGYFAVGMANGTNQKAYILNDAGTQQGGAFSEATTAGGSSNRTKIISDGAAFWLIWHRNTDLKCCTSKLPTSGTGYATVITTTATTQYNFFLDAFYDNGLICAISINGTNTAPTFWVISTATGGLVDAAGTTFGVAPGTSGGSYPRVIAGGDRSFIALYDYVTTAGTMLCVGKYAKTAVIGVVQAAAAASATVRMYSQAGAYEINAVVGSVASFDHTANSLTGNKGAILSLGVALRGIGA